jgi:Xaa-Pro dipeptidase
MVGDLVPWLRLNALADRHGVDAILVSSPENVTYLSEYWGLSHWARRGTQVYAVAWNEPRRSVDLIVPATIADQVTDEVAACSRSHVYGQFPLSAGPAELTAEESRILDASRSPIAGPLDALVSVLTAKSGGTIRLAIETGSIHPEVLSGLADRLSHVRLVPADRLLADLRSVKSPREIESLRQAALITESSIADSLASVRPAVSEIAVAQAFQRSLVSRGALPQTTVIGAGRRSALPHGQPSDRLIGAGDMVRFDVGCRFEHYVSDIARTVAVQSVTDKERASYAALWHGVEAAAAATRPGVTGAEVFLAAMTAVRAGGLADYQRGHCGHGIGIANYDLPRITADSADVIEPGMVICLETPYYRLGDSGLQVEDTFVVTENGVERVTTAPAELLAVGE